MKTKNTPKIIIAVDGYSSSGKSSMAKALARTIGYRYIDSGAMYRAVTLYGLRHGMVADGKVDEEALVAALPEIKIDFRVADGKQRTLLNGEDVEDEIREMTVSNNVSPVSTIPAVRHALVEMQQAFGEEKGIVMDGRDIGTTVFPNAEMKVFVNASAETRAQRRFLELQGKGVETTYEEVLKNVIERDHIDSTRKESPLRQAEDAICLDNSDMTIAEQDEWLLNLYHTIVAKQ
ncbi:MAG: (d)CMP kinase [Prevotella sp.]|nr:(d)CMP kinase [Muribaculaceae bacterium]MBR5440158.1 (d)CMP kinase [Prevotella sp.]